jgi:hypothetical protein
VTETPYKLFANDHLRLSKRASLRSLATGNSGVLARAQAVTKFAHPHLAGPIGEKVIYRNINDY